MELHNFLGLFLDKCNIMLKVLNIVPLLMEIDNCHKRSIKHIGLQKDYIINPYLPLSYQNSLEIDKKK